MKQSVSQVNKAVKDNESGTLLLLTSDSAVNTVIRKDSNEISCGYRQTALAVACRTRL